MDMIRSIPLRHVPPQEFPGFHKHVCPPTFSGETPDLVAPTRQIARNLTIGFDLELSDGSRVPMWILEDPDDSEGGRTFPAKTIRTVEGDIVHARVGAHQNTHTIHWHGIEPSTMNDGVGKHSFELSTGNHIYQFATNQAGLFLYHCHKNTTLHFEMGLYGALIVDPRKPDIPEAQDVPDPPYPTGGPGFIRAYNPPLYLIRYDVEAFLVPDDIDTRWHHLGHDAFMQRCDPDDPIAAENFTHDGFLHDFRPDVFVLNGEAKRADDATPFEKAAINARVGQVVLVRLLDASYGVQEIRAGLPWTLVSQDGYPFGVPPYGQYSQPRSFEAGEPLRVTAAMRGDALFAPTAPGQFSITIDFFHWVSGKKLYTATTYLNVT